LVIFKESSLPHIDPQIYHRPVEMTRRYFLNMLKEKSRRALKGDLQLSWNERWELRMTRQSGKGDQREEKGVE